MGSESDDGMDGRARIRRASRASATSFRETTNGLHPEGWTRSTLAPATGVPQRLEHGALREVQTPVLIHFRCKLSLSPFHTSTETLT